MDRIPAPRSAFADPAESERLIAEARRLRAVFFVDLIRRTGLALRAGARRVTALLSRRPTTA